MGLLKDFSRNVFRNFSWASRWTFLLIYFLSSGIVSQIISKIASGVPPRFILGVLPGRILALIFLRFMFNQVSFRNSSRESFRYSFKEPSQEFLYRFLPRFPLTSIHPLPLDSFLLLGIPVEVHLEILWGITPVSFQGFLARCFNYSPGIALGVFFFGTR